MVTQPIDYENNIFSNLFHIKICIRSNNYIKYIT